MDGSSHSVGSKGKERECVTDCVFPLIDPLSGLGERFSIDRCPLSSSEWTAAVIV